ncbi:MAG: hypothetical protein Q8L15_12110 [Methylobacter sp.]|nr:hypothetical protein [Methylobacter sp.]
MIFLAKFERNFLFGLTRSLAMFFIFATLATLIVGGLVVGISQLSNSDSNIAPQEVIDSLKPALPVETMQPNNQQQTSQPTTQTQLLPPGLKMPFVLQKHFSDPDDIRRLANWLDEVPDNQQQVFLDEMATVVTQAEKEHIEPFSAINAYHKLKMEKLTAQRQTEAGNVQTWLWYAGALGAGIIIIALFSLILVLLAIERNTRRIDE